MNRLTEVPTDKILRWCIHRQVKGFQGRVNKPEDTCYAFWIGATLQLLDGLKWVDDVALRDFLSLTATNYGGHGKEPDDLPGLLLSCSLRSPDLKSFQMCCTPIWVWLGLLCLIQIYMEH